MNSEISSMDANDEKILQQVDKIINDEKSLKVLDNKTQEELKAEKKEMEDNLVKIKDIYTKQTYEDADKTNKKIKTIIQKDRILKQFVNLSIIYIHVIVKYSVARGNDLRTMQKKLDDLNKEYSELLKNKKNSNNSSAATQEEFKKIIEGIRDIAINFLDESGGEDGGGEGEGGTDSIKKLLGDIKTLLDKTEKIKGGEISALNDRLYSLIEMENEKLYKQVNQAPRLITELNNAVKEPVRNDVFDEEDEEDKFESAGSSAGNS